MIRKIGLSAVFALSVAIGGMFGPGVSASCTGACWVIDEKETRWGTICYCDRADDGHCDCTQWTSNGEVQCLAYGSCSYAP